jgi:hypothetical protein
MQMIVRMLLILVALVVFTTVGVSILSVIARVAMPH